MLNGRWLVDKSRIGIAKQVNDNAARLPDGLLGNPRIIGIGRFGINRPPVFTPENDWHQPAIAPHDLAKTQLSFTPPVQVGGIAEGTDHQDARTLFGIYEFGWKDWYAYAEKRCDGMTTEQVAIACVIGMGGYTDAGSKQFRTSSRNCEGLSAVLYAKADAMEGPQDLTIFHLRLGYGRLKIDIPHHRRFHVVDVALMPEVDEAVLRSGTAAAVDGRVLKSPIYRQADARPKPLECLLVLSSQS